MVVVVFLIASAGESLLAARGAAAAALGITAAWSFPMGVFRWAGNVAQRVGAAR